MFTKEEMKTLTIPNGLSSILLENIDGQLYIYIYMYAA